MKKKRIGRKPKVPHSVQLQIFLDVLSSTLTHEELADHYGVKTSYVRYIYYRWRDDPPQEIAERLRMNLFPDLEEDEASEEANVPSLKKELAFAKLKIEALEKMIELAEEAFEIQIVKKSGSQQQDT